MLSAEGYTSCWRPCRIRLAAAIGRKFAPIISKERAREREESHSGQNSRSPRETSSVALARHGTHLLHVHFPFPLLFGLNERHLPLTSNTRPPPDGRWKWAPEIS